MHIKLKSLLSAKAKTKTKATAAKPPAAKPQEKNPQHLSPKLKSKPSADELEDLEWRLTL
jgi:hypothetical protein